jgi:hypothetical protein
MKNSLLSLSVLGLSLILSGCGRDLASTVKGAQKVLGVEIQLNAPATDACLAEQVESIYQEYRALSKSQQEAVVRTVKASYKKIVLNQTILGKKIEGEQVLLGYEVHNGQNYYLVTNKNIGGKTEVTGTGDRTIVAKENGVLRVTTQLYLDESLRKFYRTRDINVYDRSENALEEAFLSGRRSGVIYLSSEVATPTTACASSVTLQSFL